MAQSSEMSKIIEVPGALSGLNRLYNTHLNKGLSFTLEERQILGIQGLLPPVVRPLEDQVKHCLLKLDRLNDDLEKNIFLMDLAGRNERLFFNVIATDIRKFMPIIYTPVVGLRCQKFSLLYSNPCGLFITIKDKGHVYNILKNWPVTQVKAVCVTDGERILGLGDLGANGMGIPIGKLFLYTILAHIPPHYYIPITLDVGTNTQSILDDPLYIGLRQKRVTGPAYDEFLDEFVQAVVKRFGQTCLIHFEDFGNANAFKLLNRYIDTHCVFNDDIQGTGAVILAGLLGYHKIKNMALKDSKFLFQGAGEAALGIASLCCKAMEKEGLTEEEARKRIYMVDSNGLIVKNRPKGGLTENKLVFAQEHEPIDTLEEAVTYIKPSILIGASAVPGAFTPSILKKMAEFNENPMIFPLSNPTSKAECTAEDAFIHTEGRCIFASGSPFPPVEYNGKTYQTGQGNNAYIFPGLALGIISSGMKIVNHDIYPVCAETLAGLCTPEDIAVGRIYPHISMISKCSFEIAMKVVEFAYEKGLATVFPEPVDKKALIESHFYDLKYPSAIPDVYKWSDN